MHLDFSTLIRILSRQKRHGTWQANNISIPGWSKTVQASIQLHSGDLFQCVLQTSTGADLLRGKDAYDLLLKTGETDWLGPDLLGIAAAPSLDDTIIPRRAEGFKSSVFKCLSPQYAEALELVDGRRSAAWIAVLMSLPLEKVSRILDDLRENNYIT